VPAIDVACGEDDFGVRVGLDEFFGKCHGGPVTHGLAMSEQLVPLFAAKGSLAVILGRQGIGPHQAVGRVLHRRRHHVVTVVEAELLEGGAEGCGAGAAETQREHSHGDDPTAFAPIDVRVGGEQVGHGLGSIGSEGHGGGPGGGELECAKQSINDGNEVAGWSV
jgi:hypothetical protein